MGRDELTKILYVEDDPDIQEIAQLALCDVGGFEVKICSLGTEALKVLGNYIPDLILLDVMMPDMDGVTTFKEIRKRGELKEIPIIFLTARVQAEEVKEYRKLGALEVIFKPFDPMTISDTIQDIWQNG